MSQLATALNNELLALVNNDRKCANRLLKHALQSNPGRPGRWYWEKVISDLKRDRRY